MIIMNVGDWDEMAQPLIFIQLIGQVVWVEGVDH